MKIVLNIEYIHPPIPSRLFDYRCSEDGKPESGEGWGMCVEDAIVQFAQQFNYVERDSYVKQTT